MLRGMEYTEFKRHLGKAGLTVAEFASLTGKRSPSISNYAVTNDVPSHVALIAVLMGEMADHGIDFRAAAAKVEFKTARPRGRSFGRGE